MAQLKNRRKKSVALIAAAGLTVAGTGVAFAYWTSTGTGDGTATTGQSAAFVIVVDDPEGAALSPGGPAQTVDFTVTNPGTGNLELRSVTVAVANDAGVPFSTGDCTSADYSATITTAPAAGTVAGGASRTGTATIAMVETQQNQDGCKGREVPLHFVAI